MGYRRPHAQRVTAFFGSVSVTVPGAVNTEGGFVSLGTPATVDCLDGLFIAHRLNASSTPVNWLSDIHVGAAGSEIGHIANALGRTVFSVEAHQRIMPVRLPGGVEARTRYQASNVTGHTMILTALAFAAQLGLRLGGHVCDAYGASGGSSAGTQVSVPSTADTDSVWAQLTAATTRPHKQLMLVTTWTAGNVNTRRWKVDVGIGASGQEQEIVSDAVVTCSESSGPAECRPQVHGPFQVAIPAGTRLAVRAQSNTANNNTLDVVAYGIS